MTDIGNLTEQAPMFSAIYTDRKVGWLSGDVSREVNPLVQLKGPRLCLALLLYHRRADNEADTDAHLF